MPRPIIKSRFVCETTTELLERFRSSPFESQHENISIHKAHVIKKWLEKMMVQEIDCLFKALIFFPLNICGIVLKSGWDTTIYISQNYNASVHKTHVIKQWFGKMRVQKFDLSFQSTGLSPTKQLWDDLENRLRNKPRRPTSITQLLSLF